MSELAHGADNKARFAARELVARFEREMGVVFPPAERVHIFAAFEIGYLRGYNEGMTDASIQAYAALDELKKVIAP